MNLVLMTDKTIKGEDDMQKDKKTYDDTQNRTCNNMVNVNLAGCLYNISKMLVRTSNLLSKVIIRADYDGLRSK